MERLDRIQSMVSSGKSAKEIAFDLGVSKQRVYQLLSKAGVAIPKRPRPERISKRYGMPMSEVRKLVACGATRAYTYQRRNADWRGISWELTFEEWWKIWSESGKWNVRGREKGGWVMGRLGDKGPYAIGNVVICNHSENAKVAQSHARRRIRVARIEAVRSAKRPYAVRRGAEYFGSYASMEEALEKKREIDSQGAADVM